LKLQEQQKKLQSYIDQSAKDQSLIAQNKKGMKLVLGLQTHMQKLL